MKHLSRTISSSLAGVVAAAVLAVSPAALAQGDASEKQRLTPEAKLEKKLARMERMVRERLSPRLGLDDAQEEQLVRAFQESAQERKQAMMAVKAERKALKELVERGAPEAELDAQLKRLEAAGESVPKRGALLDKTAGFLTAEQQAKLALVGPKHGKHGKYGKHGKRFKHGKRGVDGQRAR